MHASVEKRSKELSQCLNRLHEAKQIETEQKAELNLHTTSICCLNEEKAKYI